MGVRQWFGFEDEDQKSWQTEFDEVCKCCSLSYTQRLYGFLICMGIGVILDIAAIFSVATIILHPERFAILYSIGNIICICSTLFLWGPWSQLKNMFAKKRVIATCLYLGSIILTLVLAYRVQKAGPVILSLILQFCAFIWYTFSYIPYGRQCLTNVATSMC